MSNNSQIPFDPLSFDVVCTKLRTWNSKHSGNIFFNKLIGEFARLAKEEEIKKYSERLVDIVTSKGGRFLRLSDADCLSGNKPSMCTELDQKAKILKVSRTLRTAYLKHHGTLTKRVRNPATRRKKTKAYELLAGATPIHPYALHLLGAVMNSVRNVPYRELDKPGEPYTIESEPQKLRLLRLQLRHRLVGAKEAMMPAVEFGHAMINHWGGRVVVQKIPLPTVGNSPDGTAADKAVGTPTSHTANNTPKTATSNTSLSSTTVPTSPLKETKASQSKESEQKKKETKASQSKESEQKKKDMKEQLRAATREKMKTLMNVGGAIRSSPAKATPVRESLASKTLPSVGKISLPIGTKPTQQAHSTKGRHAGSRADDKTTKPVRGSLASKTLPLAASNNTTTTAASKDLARGIGSLVRNLEQAKKGSPFESPPKRWTNQTTNSAANEGGTLNQPHLEGAPRPLLPPPSMVPDIRRSTAKDSARSGFDTGNR